MFGLMRCKSQGMKSVYFDAICNCTWFLRKHVWLSVVAAVNPAWKCLNRRTAKNIELIFPPQAALQWIILKKLVFLDGLKPKTKLVLLWDFLSYLHAYHWDHRVQLLLLIISVMIPKSLIKTQCKFYNNIYAFEIIVFLLQENTIFVSCWALCCVWSNLYGSHCI